LGERPRRKKRKKSKDKLRKREKQRRGVKRLLRGRRLKRSA